MMLASIAINGLWNKRSGPGGGTRRLHHKVLWGRIRIDTRSKDGLFARYGSVVIGLTIISVNRNGQTRRVGANNNRLVANRNRRDVAVARAA